MEEKMISAFKGQAILSVPADWLKGLNMNNSCAFVGGEARIRFPNGKGYGIRVYRKGSNLFKEVRQLSPGEIATTEWGPPCYPWEWKTPTPFLGSRSVVKLNELDDEPLVERI